MKKTVSVNISGFIFNIEEDAYEVMLDYLNTLKSHLKKTEGGDEIYTDIEGRIAELFQERLNDNKQVVTLDDVNEVIAIIGKPEEYLFDDELNEEKEADSSSAEEVDFDYDVERRVFRDTDHSIIGGVCSGIARYFDVDPVLIRLAFALLFFGFGTGILLYIILWVIIPEPKNNADRLRMHGRPVNMENLKDQFQKVKKNPGRRKDFKRSADFAKDVGGNFFKVFGKVLGFAFVFGAIIGIIVLFSLTFGTFNFYTDQGNFESVNLHEFTGILFQTKIDSFLAWTGVFLTSIVPIIAMLVFGIQLIAEIKSKHTKVVGWILAGLFTLGVIFITVAGTQTLREFSNHSEFEESLYEVDQVDEIYIDVKEDEYFSSNVDYDDFDLMELIQLHDDYVYIGYPELTLQTSPDTSFHVIAIYSSRGISSKSAIGKAENIIYEVEREGNQVLFSPYFKFPSEDKFRNQQVEIVIQVPQGKRITFGPNTSRILDRLDDDRVLDADKVNKTYEMRGKDLILAN